MSEGGRATAVARTYERVGPAKRVPVSEKWSGRRSGRGETNELDERSEYQ
jgi:hypothetical protein